MNLAHKNCKKNSPVAAIYLHIPFCRLKCPFCSFAVIRDRERFHEKYILGMIDEIKKRAEWMGAKQNFYDKKYTGQKLLKSIYFGGGTPSSLRITEVDILLSQVRNFFPCF